MPNYATQSAMPPLFAFQSTVTAQESRNSRSVTLLRRSSTSSVKCYGHSVEAWLNHRSLAI